MMYCESIHECECGCLLREGRVLCKRCETDAKTKAKMMDEISSRLIIDTMQKHAKSALDVVESFMAKHGREPNRIGLPAPDKLGYFREPTRILGIEVLWMDVQSPVAILMEGPKQ